MNTVLLSTAASIGIIHTAIGIDHYIPFAAMGKSNNWSFRKTMLVVLICGLGHVSASIILGIFGIVLGAQISALVGIQDMREEIAKWFLISFGLVYMLWGLRRAVRNKPHRHISADGNEVWHDHHKDAHDDEPAETHIETKSSRSFWPLFILFVLGPCEPLIPLLMYPAAEAGAASVAMVAVVYSICTITSMIVCTAIVLKGINMIPMKKVERFSHALAGFAVLMCGLAIQFLGI